MLTELLFIGIIAFYVFLAVMFIYNLTRMIIYIRKLRERPSEDNKMKMIYYRNSAIAWGAVLAVISIVFTLIQLAYCQLMQII